jgi:predicted hydrolase (HD superfamily)
LDDTVATKLSEGLLDVVYSDLTGGVAETIWKQENSLRKHLEKVNACMRNLLSTIFEDEEKYISPCC